MIKLTDLIGTAFYDMFHMLENNKYMHYWLKGGRGSLKSSFVAIYIIWLLTKKTLSGEIVHAVVFRKVHNTIKDSVFVKLLWAIEKLGLGNSWSFTISPMRLSFGDSSILFRGCANKRDFEKIKGITFEKGYCVIGWYDEITEFLGMNEVTPINQSVFRGGPLATALYTFNPPPSANNWCNKEVSLKKDHSFVHHSTYLDVPESWLGKAFIDEANFVKKINPRMYSHMYLGEVIGEGIEIYKNVTIRTISDEEIETFTEIKHGMDFGYSDASSYNQVFYDRGIDKVFSVKEVYGAQLSNQTLYESIFPLALNNLIRSDGAEPRTINELKMLGLNIMKAKKGADSKRHGIKWLQDRAEIIIDRHRTPYTAVDFQTWEYKRDKNGEIIREYPLGEPHTSASIRYGLNDIMLDNKFVLIK